MDLPIYKDPKKQRQPLRYRAVDFLLKSPHKVTAMLWGGAVVLGLLTRYDPRSTPIQIQDGNRPRDVMGRVRFTTESMKEFMRAAEAVLHKDEEVVCLGSTRGEGRVLEMGCVHTEGSGEQNLMQDFGLALLSRPDGVAAMAPRMHPGGIVSIDAAALAPAANVTSPADLPPPLTALPARYFIHGTPAELGRLGLQPRGADRFLAYLNQDALLAAGLCSLSHGIDELEFTRGAPVKCVARERPLDLIDRTWQASDTGDRADPGFVVTREATEASEGFAWLDWSSSSRPYSPGS